MKWNPKSLYDPNLTKVCHGKAPGSSISWLWVGGIHFDDEDGMLYFSEKDFVGRSPEGSVILSVAH